MTTDSLAGYVEASLRLASVMLDDATFLLSRGRHGSAVDRAYYAMVHSSQAALAVRVLSRRPKSHAGLRSLLGQELVRSGKLERNYAYDLARAFDLRQRCTYDPLFLIEGERAANVVGAAGDFLTRMRRIAEEGA